MNLPISMKTILEQMFVYYINSDNDKSRYYRPKIGGIYLYNDGRIYDTVSYRYGCYYNNAQNCQVYNKHNYSNTDIVTFVKYVYNNKYADRTLSLKFLNEYNRKKFINCEYLSISERILIALTLDMANAFPFDEYTEEYLKIFNGTSNNELENNKIKMKEYVQKEFIRFISSDIGKLIYIDENIIKKFNMYNVRIDNNTYTEYMYSLIFAQYSFEKSKYYKYAVEFAFDLSGNLHSFYLNEKIDMNVLINILRKFDPEFVFNLLVCFTTRFKIEILFEMLKYEEYSKFTLQDIKDSDALRNIVTYVPSYIKGTIDYDYTYNWCYNMEDFLRYNMNRVNMTLFDYVHMIEKRPSLFPYIPKNIIEKYEYLILEYLNNITQISYDDLDCIFNNFKMNNVKISLNMINVFAIKIYRASYCKDGVAKLNIILSKMLK